MSSTHILTLEGVSYRPAQARSLALDSVTANFQAGRVVAVVGPNGAGKSTLLRVLAGLVSPSTGNVWIDDQLPYPTDLRARARLVHYVPTNLEPVFDFTVRQTAAMGRYPHRGRSGSLSKADQAQIDTALALTELGTFAQRSVLTLSSGELRRVWMARALVSEARFLLLDEPTANLDLAHALALAELTRQLATSGCGVVIAIHDLEAAYQMADQVLLMDQARLEAFGAPAEVLTDENVARVFGVRFRQTDASPNGVARRQMVSASQS